MLTVGAILSDSQSRCLFSETCFDDRLYHTTETYWSYEDYITGRNESAEALKDKPRTGTQMKFLQRGRHRSADKFLDWLVRQTGQQFQDQVNWVNRKMAHSLH